MGGTDCVLECGLVSGLGWGGNVMFALAYQGFTAEGNSDLLNCIEGLEMCGVSSEQPRRQSESSSGIGRALLSNSE